jgi:hypothetical protein
VLFGLPTTKEIDVFLNQSLMMMLGSARHQAVSAASVSSHVGKRIVLCEAPVN